MTQTIEIPKSEFESVSARLGHVFKIRTSARLYALCKPGETVFCASFQSFCTTVHSVWDSGASGVFEIEQKFVSDPQAAEVPESVVPALARDMMNDSVKPPYWVPFNADFFKAEMAQWPKRRAALEENDVENGTAVIRMKDGFLELMRRSQHANLRERACFNQGWFTTPPTLVDLNPYYLEAAIGSCSSSAALGIVDKTLVIVDNPGLPAFKNDWRACTKHAIVEYKQQYGKQV